MSRFYFNDCLPSCSEQAVFIHKLSNTLQAFHRIAENLNIEKAIVTEKLPSTMFLGNLYSLDDTISKIKDGALRTLAYAYFTKYPIATHLGLEEAVCNELLEANYCIKINNNSYDALNLAMVYHNKTDNICFTVALHKDLEQPILCMKPLKINNNSKYNTDLNLNNLYGDVANTQGIENLIRIEMDALKSSNLSKFEQLESVIGTLIISTQAKKTFFKLTVDEQESIIVHFKRAKNRGSVTPFAPGESIIKDVTTNCKIKVCELRVFSPTAVRVYFNETDKKVFIASIELKSNPDQNKDIKNACITLTKMILTS